jgi:hypothetical protein
MSKLVFGSGVIGIINAIRLYNAAYPFMHLALSHKFDEISHMGVTISNNFWGDRMTWIISADRELSLTNFFELIMDTLRLDPPDAQIPVFQESPVCQLKPSMIRSLEDKDHLRQMPHKEKCGFWRKRASRWFIPQPYLPQFGSNCIHHLFKNNYYGK